MAKAGVGAIPEDARALPMPDGCALVDAALPPGVDSVFTLSGGVVRIWLNARLDDAARARAIRHELWHYWRGDLSRDADIRDIEAEAPVVRVTAIDGTPLLSPAPVFAPDQLRPVGRGVYLPVGEGLRRAARDIERLCDALDAACGVFDVVQTPPLVPVAALRACVDDLRLRAAESVAFVAWQSPGACDALPVVLQFGVGGAEGALYYRRDGHVDNALALIAISHAGLDAQIAFDLRRRGARLSLCAIHRMLDGRPGERVY